MNTYCLVCKKYTGNINHKDLINRTEADNVLRDKSYDIASNPEYDGYQRGLASMVYKFLIKSLRQSLVP